MSEEESIFESITWKTKLLSGTIVLVIFTVLGSLLFYGLCVTSIEVHEQGFIFDRYTGQIEVIKEPGWVVRMPIRYSVHAIDLRPYQVSITANFNNGDTNTGIASRILNAKLVRFNPVGLETFVKWHGRDAGDNVGNLKEILKCYAFDSTDGADCPFLTVISEVEAPQGFKETSNGSSEKK